MYSWAKAEVRASNWTVSDQNLQMVLPQIRTERRRSLERLCNLQQPNPKETPKY